MQESDYLLVKQPSKGEKRASLLSQIGKLENLEINNIKKKT